MSDKCSFRAPSHVNSILIPHELKYFSSVLSVSKRHQNTNFVHNVSILTPLSTVKPTVRDLRYSSCVAGTSCLQWCDAVYLGEHLPTFREIISARIFKVNQFKKSFFSPRSDWLWNSHSDLTDSRRQHVVSLGLFPFCNVFI